MHTRLVNDDVGELGQVVFDIVNASSTLDAPLARPPKYCFVNAVSFSFDFFRKPKRLEQFHGAACDAIRLTHQ